MRHGLVIAVILAGCPRKTAPAPPPAPVATGTIVVLQEGGSLFAIDAAAARAETVPGFERLETLSSDARFAAQLGPYLTFSHSDTPYLVDLRDLSRTALDEDAIVAALRAAWSISSAPGETVIVGDEDGRITVATEPAGAARTLPMPGTEIVSLVASPDGATLAVVAGPPQDLFTIRVQDGATERWTNDGSALDVAFLDDAHVMFVRDESDTFHVLDLETRKIEDVPTPDGWAPDLLDAYVGRSGDETSDVYAVNGAAPLLPLVNDDTDDRALFDPRSGGVIGRGRAEQILAVARDGGAIAVTTECNGTPGGLTRRTAGETLELRAAPTWETCSASTRDESGPLRISAAFSADGHLVFAEPHGGGWRVVVADPAGAGRTILESPTPLHVFAWP